MKADAPEVLRSDQDPLPKDEPIYSDDGVDLTLIRWMLSMTPTERLQVLQDTMWSIARLRGDDLKT